MKKYYVSVNGTRYEVEVEEVKGEFSPSVAAAPTAAAPRVEANPQPVTQPAPQPAAPAPVKEEAAPVPQPVSDGNSEGEVIECPMPGTILKVNVSAGSTVKKGDVLFVLEAMKMENEIMASRDGKITHVGVTKGTVVNTGDTLAKMA